MACRRGVLVIPEEQDHSRGCDCRFIVDGLTGRLVLPADTLDLRAAHGVLCIPDEDPTAVQLTVELSDATDDPALGHAADRWTAYHNRPRAARPRWAAATVVSARRGADVADAAELDLRNPLHGPAEHALCRLANADPAALARAVRAHAGAAPPDPRAVGIDPRGVDVRCDFAIVRIAFPAPAPTEALAAAALSVILDNPCPPAAPTGHTT